MGSFFSKVKKLLKKDKAVAQGEGRTHTFPAQNIYTFTGIIHNDTYPEIDPATKSDCSGKAVLVTGANKGVGKALVISYAKAGASQIAICTRGDSSDVAAEVLEAAKAAGKPAPALLLLRLDVTDQTQIADAVATVTSQWGRLDILVNNAGYMPEDAFNPLHVTDKDEYEYAWEVNWWGAIRLTRALIPLLLQGGDKTVIHMSSIGALFSEGGGESYATAKFALCRSAEFLCNEYKNEGLLAYAIHPGGILTDLGSRLPKPFYHLLIDTVELGADSIVFLTSKKRQWLGGRWINCEWDMPRLMAKEKEIVEHNLLKFKLTGLV